MAHVDIAAFREQEAKRLITGRLHPTHDLIIWNYTPQCMWDNAWDDVTMQARGLITTSNGEIVARPFKKFFNYGEPGWTDFPDEPFTVTTKEDGSLGILYSVDGTPAIATRGSFTSEQALKATAILHEKYGTCSFRPYYTYLFEIVYPANRIVLDYGDMEDLILLAVIYTRTGEEIDIHDPTWVQSWPFPVVRRYDGVADVAQLLAMDDNNKEGFVLRFESGLRLKVKFEEYKRIHAIITRTSNRTVWQHLKENKPMAEILERVPDEFAGWVRAQSRDLSQRYQAIHSRVQTAYKQVLAETTIPVPIPIAATLSVKDGEMIRRALKKRIAEQFHARYPDIESFLFILYNNPAQQSRTLLHDAIWDSLYPAYSRPFMERSEDAA